MTPDIAWLFGCKNHYVDSTNPSNQSGKHRFRRYKKFVCLGKRKGRRIMIDRRTLIASGVALAAAPARAKPSKTSPRPAFPPGFLWGAATAGHQVEGNNINSDCWVMENVKPTLFAEPSRDADHSFALWPRDMDLVKALGLNTYRFSLEWARIEPEEGLFSVAMLDHYKHMIEGCRARGLNPMVTFNHFTTPRWFAAAGGWTNPKSPQYFARYCDRAMRHLGAGISHATTLNEPNIMQILRVVLPPQIVDVQRAMLLAAAKAVGSDKFVGGNAVNPEDIDSVTRNLVIAHKTGRAAMKAIRPDLPVGVSLSMFDDQAVGKNSIRDAMRAKLYQPWLEVIKGDDFLGVQNYERQQWSATGKLPAPAGSDVNYMGSEVFAPSLAGAVRYAHAATGVPIIVTEHGVGTTDDAVRARLIPAALAELKKAIDDGIPVKGYMHWSLADNFEWIFGYKVKFGLHSVDPANFERTPKPSAAVFSAIAKQNALPAA
jgi:beta-glucosidase